jgi:hypothetical protein
MFTVANIGTSESCWLWLLDAGAFSVLGWERGGGFVDLAAMPVPLKCKKP